MALNTNPFVEGIDPTSTFGGYASVLLQLIRQAIPSSTYGMILFDTTAPDVTGSNAWRKTCLWLSLANPSVPTLNVYKELPSPGWVNVNNIIGNGAIVNAMIANNAVTLAKLATTGGAANQLIRVNAGGGAFEFVSLSSLVTTGSLNVGSLITTGIPGGQFRLAGTYGPGVANWYTAENIIDNLPNASIPTDLLGPAPAATSRSQFLTTRLGDPFAAWRYFDPTNDLQANALNGDRVTNNTIALSKIIPATSDAVLVTSGGVVDWVPSLTIVGSTTKFVTSLASLGSIPVVGTPTTLAHTLATMPLMYRVMLYCETPERNYINGDEIDASNIQMGATGDWYNAFSFHPTTAGVEVRRTFSSTIHVVNKTTGAVQSITDGHWRLRLYAMKVA
jgi:hypothetical protein